jgi:hypothetical protein
LKHGARPHGDGGFTIVVGTEVSEHAPPLRLIPTADEFGINGRVVLCMKTHDTFPFVDSVQPAFTPHPTRVSYRTIGQLSRGNVTFFQEFFRPAPLVESTRYLVTDIFRPNPDK